MSDDPTAIRSLAVTSGDVVAAYEARRRSSRRPVLRVTPPFSGRMRARLHDPGPSSATGDADRETDSDFDAEVGPGAGADLDPGTDLDAETGALHLPPARLVAADAVPSYPDPDETEDALREDPDAEFSVETHRERHVAAVEEWRTAVAESVVGCVDLRLPEGTHRVEVKTLDDGG